MWVLCLKCSQITLSALFSPESQQSLVQAIRKQLVFPTSPDVEIVTWTDLAKEMEGLLLEIMG